MHKVQKLRSAQMPGAVRVQKVSALVEGGKTTITCTKEITAEQYGRAMENHGVVAECDRHDIFTDAELYGYGVYLPRVRADNGKYICEYNRGESCD